MKRDAVNHLKLWMSRPERKPLVIRGARQVGKTELVRLFCLEENLHLIEINLEERGITEFEREENFSIDRAINEILALTQSQLTPRTLIFIDEIQESLKAYERLRFFKEKRPDLPVIVAGSLLEAKLKEEKIKAPVGRVEYLFLGPMTFGEFLLAKGQEQMFDQISSLNLKQINNPLARGVHQELEILLREFLFVGGMPECIKRFTEGGGNYNLAREAQVQILEAYREDIHRYAEDKLSSVIEEVFEKFSMRIGEKNKYNELSAEKTTYVEKAINKMKDVFLLQKVIHTNCSGLPLKAGEKANLYKLFHLDVGLYNCQMNLSWEDLVKSENILTKGKMAEQFVAQHLYFKTYQVKKNQLHYWLRDQSSQKAEIDFVIENGCLTPIEVKSGKAGGIKSLVTFVSEKQSLSPRPLRFDLNYRESFLEEVTHKMATGDKLQFQLLSFPLYSVEFL